MTLLYKNPADKFGTHDFSNVQIQNIFEFLVQMTISPYLIIAIQENEILINRNYSFHNTSYSHYDILIYLEHIHAYNHTVEVYRIN